MISRLDISDQVFLSFAMAKIIFKMNEIHDIRKTKFLGPQFFHF